MLKSRGDGSSIYALYAIVAAPMVLGVIAHTTVASIAVIATANILFLIALIRAQ